MPPSLRSPLQPFVQGTKPPRDAGKPRGLARLGLPPIIKNRRFVGLRPWPWRQIVGRIFTWSGQEPKLFFCRVALKCETRRVFRPFLPLNLR